MAQQEWTRFADLQFPPSDISLCSSERDPYVVPEVRTVTHWESPTRQQGWSLFGEGPLAIHVSPGTNKLYKSYA